jgi:phosphatidic acid-selective phospholipase A1
MKAISSFENSSDLINFLVSETGAPLSSFHPVGFSLGGQVVGHLGYKMGGKLHRITGLDPAGKLT